MKTVWIVIICVAAFIVVYYLLNKIIRKKEEKNIRDLLFKRHLGDTFEKTMYIIKKTMFENVFIDGIKEDENYKYIFTHSPSYRTVKMYQFKDNICSGFFIESYEEKYSLPCWKYNRKYIKMNNNWGYSVSDKDFQYELAYYTVLNYFELFPSSFIRSSYFRYFEKFHKVADNRVIGVAVAAPFTDRKYPIYSYLCSCNQQEIDQLDDFLSINEDDVKHFFQLQ